MMTDQNPAGPDDKAAADDVPEDAVREDDARERATRGRRAANDTAGDRSDDDGHGHAANENGPPEARTGDGLRSEDRETVEEEVAGTNKAITELEDELNEVRDQMLRAVAEAENIRKRAEKQTEDAHKYANANFAKSLLSVADNLRRAIEAVPEDEVADDALLKNLLDGVGAVERELLAAFQQHGVEKIEPLGEVFDPHFHQAMFEIETAEQAAGTVVQVVAPGYVLNDRLLRAAMVAVAKAPTDDT